MRLLESRAWATISRRRQHRDPLPPQHRLPRQLAPPLLACSVSVKREDKLTDFSCPRPTPAVDAEDRHHARDTCSEQRQRIKGTLTHKEWSAAFS